jgi:acyl carrier protein
MSTTLELETFIRDELVPGRAIGEIAPGDDLLARGIIDSLGITQLVEFLETRYGVKVGPDDLLPANFRDLQAIETFIARRRDGAPC